MRTAKTVSELRCALGALPGLPAGEHASSGEAREVREVRSAREVGSDPAPTVGLDPSPTVGLVATMGALHEGHLSLIKRARQECGVVVVSLFVNPSQFDDPTDLDRYPRQELRDAEIVSQAGADILFAPSPEEVYPGGFATTVDVQGPIATTLEGAHRGSAHFRGVATVVLKLLCMTAPDIAYFGQKDAQQVAVIRRMTTDLNLPVRIESCPTVREGDGLAMSSRNAHLSSRDRRRAVALSRALGAVERRAGAGERNVARLVWSGLAEMDKLGVEVEYLAIVDPDTLDPLATVEGPALVAVAARFGSVRLIDNTTIVPALMPTDQHHQERAPHATSPRELIPG